MTPSVGTLGRQEQVRQTGSRHGMAAGRNRGGIQQHQTALDFEEASITDSQGDHTG